MSIETAYSYRGASLGVSIDSDIAIRTPGVEGFSTGRNSSIVYCCMPIGYLNGVVRTFGSLRIDILYVTTDTLQSRH